MSVVVFVEIVVVVGIVGVVGVGLSEMYGVGEFGNVRVC